MARYKLISIIGGAESEIENQRKNTRRDVDRWIDANINGCGLDWRVGYTIKFRNSITIYEWRWIKNNAKIKT